MPDAVLVGGAATAMYAEHRESFHDHVLATLADRYAEVVEARGGATEGWVTSVRASSPQLTLLRWLDGVEAGLRQLRWTRPLEEVEDVRVADRVLRVPTLAES